MASYPDHMEGKIIQDDLAGDARDLIPVPYIRAYQVPRPVNVEITRTGRAVVRDNGQLVDRAVLWFKRADDPEAKEAPYFLKLDSQTRIHNIGEALGTFDIQNWKGKKIQLVVKTERHFGQDHDVIRVEKYDPSLKPRVDPNQPQSPSPTNPGGDE